PPYIPIFILGVAFSLVPAAMWPAVTKIVGENKIGTAYGAMFSVQNLGLWALPILIGMVLDSSNPDYQTELTNAQYVTLQETGEYRGTYYKGKDEIGKNAEFKVKYIVHEDSCTGNIVWRAIHEVQSGENGEYTIRVGEEDIITQAEFEKLNIDQYNLGIRVEDMDRKKEPLIVDETLNIGNTDEPYSGIYRSSGELITNEKFDALITVYNRENNDVVYKEKQNLRTDDQGKMHIEIGEGVVQEAGYRYFNLKDGTYCAEVLTPLDYTNSMLMLSLLGVLGLFFAFLLKRDDKTSGYGLEKPNKTE
ncbi:MAG: hypothetical protein KGY69_11445, partial [Bacteroidales bacterium]|nr:hypothetical protein [Bacteroidales bacterium]